jgi:hypothetical protein
MAFGAGLLPPSPARASVPPSSTLASDSSDLVKEARKRQADFETFRERNIPVVREGPGRRCDQRILRICIWFGGEEEERFPPESEEVSLARNELINMLADAAQKIHDPWIMGQLVQYVAQAGRYADAEKVARKCELTESWWCSALLGYALHLEGQEVASEEAFRKALATLPDDKDLRERWLTPLYIFTPGAEKDFKHLEPDEQSREWDLFWRLSDPLYLVEGNDRFTDHYARWVEVENQRDAQNPEGMPWGEDLDETLVRYGRNTGWSRVFSPEQTARQGFRGRLVDTRQVVGHHAPHSRGYLFPEQFLKSPSDIPPESWITAPRESRTWYAPPYAPDFRGLESQVGRFRRTDRMLVVGAYRPAPPTLDTTGTVAPSPYGGREAPPAEGPVQSGLFLVPLDGGPTVDTLGASADGVFTLTAAPGQYVTSLEVFDAAHKRAWRARQGVRQDPLVPGIVAVSDLMLLEPGAPVPGSLEEAIPHIRRDVRVHRGERFRVVWEVYGLGVQDPAQVTLGFTEGRPGFLQRVGKFLGVIQPSQPVEVSFSETNPNAEQTLFRTMEIELPDLDPGDYTLHLRLDLPGRGPAITSRPIIVEP